MPKINIKVSHHNPESDISNELIGIYQDDILKYMDETGSKVRFDYKNNKLKKEVDTYRLNIDFNKEIIKVYYKELGYNFKENIKVNKIVKKDKNIEIEYELEDEIFTYRIEELKWVY